MNKKNSKNSPEQEQTKAENQDQIASEQANSPPCLDSEREATPEARAQADSEAKKAGQEDQKDQKDQGGHEAAAAELKDKLLRAMAEAENVRRRAERDKESVAKYAIANFAREMLRVHDNLRRALESIDKHTKEESGPLANLLTGVELTEREMLNALERAGIRQIAAMGQKFDPNLHEAMLEIEDQTKVPGTVIHVIEPGYVIHDRPLRPARVGISKGGQGGAGQGGAGEAKATGPLSKEGQAAYEKLADAQSEAAGSRLNEEL